MVTLFNRKKIWESIDLIKYMICNCVRSMIEDKIKEQPQKTQDKSMTTKKRPRNHTYCRLAVCIICLFVDLPIVIDKYNAISN